MTINDYDPYVTFNRTAATSSGTSAVVYLGGASLAGIFVSTDAHKGTSVTFQTATSSNGTFMTMYTSTGNTVSVTGISTQATGYYAVSPVNFLGVLWFKIVSSSTQEQLTYGLATRPLS